MSLWTRKDLLGIQELDATEINTILDTAAAFKQVGTREIKKVPALRGKTLVNFFVEPSTRTRTSFELAAFRLSADVVNISDTARQEPQNFWLNGWKQASSMLATERTNILPRRCSTLLPSAKNLAKSKASMSRSSAIFSLAGSPARTFIFY